MVESDRIPDRLSANRIACRLPNKLRAAIASSLDCPKEAGPTGKMSKLSYHLPQERMPMSFSPLSVFCRKVLICSLILAGVSSAQFVGNNPAAVDKRVNELVGQMTIEEKIDLLSGDTPFRTHPVPRLNIPFFQMADGPVGDLTFRRRRSRTRLESGWRPRGISSSHCALAKSLGAIAVPAAQCSCWARASTFTAHL